MLFEYYIDYIYTKKLVFVKKFFIEFFLLVSFILIFIFRLPIIRIFGDLFVIFSMIFAFLIYYVNVTFSYQYLVLIMKDY